MRFAQDVPAVFLKTARHVSKNSDENYSPAMVNSAQIGN
jgi:hypothetical protein